MRRRLRFSVCEPHPEGTKRLHDVRISRLTVSCRVLPRVSNYKNCSWLMDLPMAPRKIARRFASPVRHSFQLHHGLGAARNHGMRMARVSSASSILSAVTPSLRHSGASATKADPLQPFRTSPTSRITRSDEGHLPDFNGPLDIHNSGPKRCQTQWPIDDELRWARRPTCRSFWEGTRSSIS